MESKELLMAIKVLADTNNTDYDIVKNIVEESLATSLNKTFGDEYIAEVKINDDGSQTVHKIPIVDEEPDYKQKEKVDIKLKRNNLQIARQQLMQKLKEQKKMSAEEEYSEYFNEIHYVKVVSQDKRGFYVQFARNLEGYLPKTHINRTDTISNGSRIYALLKSDSKFKQHQFVFTRKGTEFVWGIVSKEDDNVQSGIVKCMAIYRDEGFKSVAVVKSSDNTIDPFLSIIGHKGTKIKSINDALGRENLVIVRWKEDPVEQLMEYIESQREGIMPENITIDEDSKVITLSYSEEYKEKLVKRKEENILNAIVPNWTVSLDLGDTNDSEVFSNLMEYFSQALDVDEEIGEAIVSMGYTNIDDFSEASIENICEIGLSEDDAESLISKSKMYIMQKKLENDNYNLISSALSIPITYVEDFEKSDIHTIEDIAECSTDELEESSSLIYKSELPVIILRARTYLGWI